MASRRTSVQGPRDSRAGVSQGKPRATKPVWRREALWRAVSCPPGFASPPNVFTRFKFHSWNPRGVLPPRLAGNSEYSQDGVNLGQRKPGLPPHGTCYCWKGWVRPVLRVLIDSACSGGPLAVGREHQPLGKTVLGAGFWKVLILQGEHGQLKFADDSQTSFTASELLRSFGWYQALDPLGHGCQAWRGPLCV